MTFFEEKDPDPDENTKLERIDIRGGKYKKTGSTRIEMTGDFTVIVNPCL